MANHKGMVELLPFNLAVLMVFDSRDLVQASVLLISEKIVMKQVGLAKFTCCGGQS